MFLSLEYLSLSCVAELNLANKFNECSPLHAACDFSTIPRNAPSIPVAPVSEVFVPYIKMNIDADFYTLIALIVKLN